MKITRLNSGKFIDELLAEHFKGPDEEIDFRVSRVLAHLGPELREIPFERNERTLIVPPVRLLPKYAFVAVVTVLVIISVTVLSRRSHFSPATVEAVGAGLQSISREGVESLGVGVPI